MSQFFGISSQLRGIIVAAVRHPFFLLMYVRHRDLSDETCQLLFTALPASFIAGPLADRYSRLRIITLGGAVYAAGMAICAGANGVPLFLVGRLIAGIGQGLFFSTAAVWQVECAPKQVATSIGRGGRSADPRADQREDR